MPTVTMPPSECRVHGVEIRPARTEVLCPTCGHAFAPGELNRPRTQEDEKRTLCTFCGSLL